MTSLLQPLPFRNGSTAKNRVVLAAMTSGQSQADGSVGEDELRWLEMRAEGGFGMVITCAAHVARDGQGFAGQMDICDDVQLPGLRRLAQAITSHGAQPLVQLFHAGWRAERSLTGVQPWSASDSTQAGNAAGARAAMEEDIAGVIASFAAATARAYQAGMAGVEILAGRGYLLSQFLSRSENRRDDAWGGGAPQRARLALAVIRAARATVPASFLVGVRISPEDLGYAVGLDLDESLQLARGLCEEGADFISLSLPDFRSNTAKRPQRHPLGEFRGAVPAGVPLMAAGNIWTRAEAEEALNLGADAVALARTAMVNPDWPKRIAHPAWQPVNLPVTEAHLLACGLSPGFVQRMRERGGILAD